VADLNRVVVDDDALDQEPEDGLLLGERDPPKSVADALAECRQVSQDFLSAGALPAQSCLLLAFGQQSLAAMGDLLTSLGEFGQVDNPRLVGINQALFFPFRADDASG
jgi:hypothetical protein